MEPSQAARLLTLCASFDRRTIGEADARAWALALADVAYDDAREAVVRHYATKREWIMPADVRSGVKAIRAERLEHFAYDPDPDESPRQYLARRRRQLAEVASGEGEPSQAPALTGGPHPSVAAALAGAFRRVPRKDAPPQGDAPSPHEPGDLSVECPDCHAPIGRRCRASLRGREQPRAHRRRRMLARGEELPDREAEARDVERRRETYLRQLQRMIPPEPEGGAP
ncbi:hypothetical protein [Streptomyces sp. NPDC093261]|uniref:hypothetical protein n=1 Tax=Streptomyces sp. NPDC093261 TaxID=3366037 RepID=UPI0037F818B0